MFNVQEQENENRCEDKQGGAQGRDGIGYEPENESKYFTHLYSPLCYHHITNRNELREAVWLLDKKDIIFPVLMMKYLNHRKVVLQNMVYCLKSLAGFPKKFIQGLMQ